MFFGGENAVWPSTDIFCRRMCGRDPVSLARGMPIL
jgi:hypothetical protein